MKKLLKNIIEKSEVIKAPRCIEVLKCDGFITLPSFMVESLVKSDDLQVKEEIIWEKCMAWAKYGVEQKRDDVAFEGGDVYTSHV